MKILYGIQRRLRGSNIEMTRQDTEDKWYKRFMQRNT